MLVMGNAYPASSDRKHYSGSSIRNDGNEDWDSETGSEVASLIEENARLRALVVKLSDIVLRNVVEQK
jgi:hypothetical protein